MRDSYVDCNAAAHLFHLKLLERSRNAENLPAELRAFTISTGKLAARLKSFLAECCLLSAFQDLPTTISQIFREKKKTTHTFSLSQITQRNAQQWSHKHLPSSVQGELTIKSLILAAD